MMIEIATKIREDYHKLCKNGDLFMAFRFQYLPLGEEGVFGQNIHPGSILDLNKCADVKGRVCSLTERQAMTLSVSTSTKCLTYTLFFIRVT